MTHDDRKHERLDPREDQRLLWVRFVSGDPLTRAEGERMTLWVEDEDLVGAFLDDLGTDRSLRSMAALEATHERFMEDTLLRLEDELRAGDRAVHAHAQRLGASAPPRPAHRAWGPLLAAAALAFAVGLGLGRLDRQEPVLLANQPFVTAVADAGTSRATPPSRLGKGLVQVPEGRTHFAFDSGATVDVDGPARLELIDDDELYFLDGRAEVSVPADVTGYKVRTPTTRLVESGATYEIVVHASQGGETEVRLLHGELSIEPGREGHWTGRDQRLTPDLFRVARVAPLKRDAAPVVLEAEGELGSFLGMIVADGEWVEFGDRDKLHTTRARLATMYEDSPENFQRFWKRAAPYARPVLLRIGDGPTERLRFDEVDELRNEMAFSVTTSIRKDGEGRPRSHGLTFEELRIQLQNGGAGHDAAGAPTLWMTSGQGPRFPQLFYDERVAGKILLPAGDADGNVFIFRTPGELQDLLEVHVQDPLETFDVQFGLDSRAGEGEALRLRKLLHSGGDQLPGDAGHVHERR